MASVGTLYTFPENYRAFKALIAAKYAQVSINIFQGFVFGETNKTVEFLSKFPAGKVPAFTTNKGENIVESNAIAYYVAKDQLKGSNDVEKAQVIQWMSFADSEILPASSAWVFPVLGIMPLDPEKMERAKQDVKVALGVLNTHLKTHTYLVGERITLADICVCCTLLRLYELVMDPGVRKPFVSVNRWFTTMVNQPQVKEVIGDFKFCTKMGEFDQSKYNAFKTFTQGGDSKTSKKEVTPKKAETGKEESAKKDKKKEKKENKKEVEPEEEPDAADALLAAEPKSKDPFDEMPKGTFNMDDFKRCYSNEDESKSIPYFWEKFDKENYSIWFGEYKYNEELQKVFMSCNLITGMFQRLDKMRKQAFSSVCLFGTDNNSSISGVWVWRGQNLAFQLSPDWQIDYESYDWKKLDPDSEETKKLVTQYFSWSGKDKEGRDFNQGKIFK